jgi:hypothetical protein
VIDRLADVAVQVGQDASRYSDFHRLSMPYFQLCKALSQYRQGNFGQAVEWAQKSIENPMLTRRRKLIPCWRWRNGGLGTRKLRGKR